MTGIPAASADSMGARKASASGIDTTIPSGFVATAASVIFPMADMSKRRAFIGDVGVIGLGRGQAVLDRIQ